MTAARTVEGRAHIHARRCLPSLVGQGVAHTYTRETLPPLPGRSGGRAYTREELPSSGAFCPPKCAKLQCAYYNPFPCVNNNVQKLKLQKIEKKAGNFLQMKKNPVLLQQKNKKPPANIAGQNNKHTHYKQQKKIKKMKTNNTPRTLTAAAKLNDRQLHTAEGFARIMANEIAANGVESEYYTRALEAWLQDAAAARIVVDGDGPAARAKAAQMAHAAAVAQMADLTAAQKADTPLYAYMNDPAKMLHFLRQAAPAIIDPDTDALQFAARVSIARRAADMTPAARAEMRAKCQGSDERPAAYVEIPAGELSKTPLKGSPYFVPAYYVDLFRALIAGTVPTIKARRKDFGPVEDAAPAAWYGSQHGEAAPAVYALKLSDRWSYARMLPLLYRACSKVEEEERKAKAKAEKAARRAAEKAAKAAPATGKKGGKKAA